MFLHLQCDFIVSVIDELAHRHSNRGLRSICSFLAVAVAAGTSLAWHVMHHAAEHVGRA
jgi:hypothetical protein